MLKAGLARDDRVPLVLAARVSGRARLLEPAGVAAIAAVSLLLMFRFDVTSGFNMLFGDIFDGVLQVALLEHWYNVFSGVSSWTQALFFYPAAGTLGYNDGYFLFGALYSVFRVFGFDPFLSSEAVDIAVKLIGFAGFHLFARQALRLPWIYAALGAGVFTAANNSYIQGRHVQLFTVAFAPVLACLLHQTLAALSQRRHGAIAGWGGASSLLFAAWLLTSFYMAWFFTVFCLLWVPVLALALGRRRLRALWADTVACWAPLASSAVLLALGLIPLVLLYGPKAAETGMHGVDEVRGYLLRPLDLVNLGGDSLFYGRLQAWFGPTLLSNDEHATGFTPILLLLFLGGTAWAWRRWDNPAARPAACMALATLVLWIMATSFGGHSLWAYVYTHLPGAKAVRVVSRVQIFLQWPVVCVAMAGLAAAQGKIDRVVGRRGPILGALTVVIGALAFAEQYNSYQIPVLDRTVEMAWLQAIPVPPADCKAFFVAEPRPLHPGDSLALSLLVGHDIDAMILAEWLRLPTVNGFASLQPPDWDLLWIDRPDYRRRVEIYADRHAVKQGLCSVSLKTGAWNTRPFPG